jgi:hypothetical protein
LATSTLTLGALLQSKAGVLMNSLSVQEMNFVSYIDISRAITQNVGFLDDEQLEVIYKAKTRSLTTLGYRNLTNEFYLLDGKQMALFPLVLKNRETGVVDICGLFFRKNIKGGWDYCTTFSGFHFDAIKRAVGELAMTQSQKELANLIIPTVSSPKYFVPGRITTVGGFMDLLVKIEDGYNTLDFKLSKGENHLITKVFTKKNDRKAGTLA